MPGFYFAMSWQWRVNAVVLFLRPNSGDYSFMYIFSVKSWIMFGKISDQEIPQSQTADYPVAPGGRAAQPSRDTRKTN